MVTLPQYSPGQLVYICAPRKSNLYDSLAGRIWGAGMPKGYLTQGERAAIEYGWKLEAEWAETADNASAQAYKTELLREHHDLHGRLPGFERPDNGEFVKGNEKVPGAKGGTGASAWSPWRSMEKATVSDIPTKPGVYCIRAVAPA